MAPKDKKIPDCKMKTLAEAEIGVTYIIKSVSCSGAALRRFLDLGLIPGTKLNALFRSPAKNPTAFLIRGAVIALRTEDCGNIVIK